MKILVLYVPILLGSLAVCPSLVGRGRSIRDVIVAKKCARQQPVVVVLRDPVSLSVCLSVCLALKELFTK